MRIAILDTSALIAFYALDLLKNLHLLYNEVKIPREVENEFLTKNPVEAERTKRFAYLSNSYQQFSWITQCNEYDNSLVLLFKMLPKIDAGESEVLAQNQSLGAICDTIIDERTAVSVAKSKSFSVHGTLYLLAKLEIVYQLCDYKKSVSFLQSTQGTRFSSQIVDAVYQKVQSELLG